LFEEEVEDPCDKTREVGNNLQQERIEAQRSGRARDRADEPAPIKKVQNNSIRLEEQPNGATLNTN